MKCLCCKLHLVVIPSSYLHRIPLMHQAVICQLSSRPSEKPKSQKIIISNHTHFRTAASSILSHTNLVFLLLHNLQLPLAMPRKSLLPILPKPHQLLNIKIMDPIHILRIRVLTLQNFNGSADDDVDGAAVRHHADVVVEDAAGVEEGDLREEKNHNQ